MTLRPVTATLAVMLASAALMIPGAGNAVTFFTDRAAWEAQVTGQTTITFEGIAPAGGFASVAPAITVSGVEFALGVPIALLLVEERLSNTDGAVLFTQGGVSIPILAIVVDFGAPYRAFAFDYGTFIGTDVGVFDVEGSSVSQQILPSSGNMGVDFFGVIADPADEPYTRISLVTVGEPLFFIDNVSFADTTAVPVPSGLALLLTGLAGFGLTRRVNVRPLRQQ